jgi:hypothetical protein
MRLMIPICILDHHRPDRDDVRWDGLSYLGTCLLCKQPIRRDDRGRWRGTRLCAYRRKNCAKISRIAVFAFANFGQSPLVFNNHALHEQPAQLDAQQGAASGEHLHQRLSLLPPRHQVPPQEGLGAAQRCLGAPRRDKWNWAEDWSAIR